MYNSNNNSKFPGSESGRKRGITWIYLKIILSAIIFGNCIHLFRFWSNSVWGKLGPVARDSSNSECNHLATRIGATDIVYMLTCCPLLFSWKDFTWLDISEKWKWPDLQSFCQDIKTMFVLSLLQLSLVYIRAYTCYLLSDSRYVVTGVME